MIQKNEIFIIIALILSSIMTGIVAVASMKYLLIAITFIIALILLYYDRRWLFFAIIVLNESFFYLINAESIPYFYHSVQILGIIALLFFIINIKTIVLNKYLFKTEMSILIMLIFVSFISVYAITGQPPLKTLYSSYMYLTYMLYFVIVILFEEYNFEEHFINLIILAGLFLAVMFSLQYFLFDKMVYLNVTSNYRYGTLRIYEINSLLPLAAVISTNRIFVSKHKLIYGFLLILSLFCIFFISKGRAIIIATTIAIIITVFLQKKVSKRLLLFAVSPIVLGIILYFLLFSKVELNIIKEIIDEFLNKSGTTGIRLDALAYFKELIKSRPLFGIGLLNLDYPKSYLLSHLQNDYFFVDVGIFGYTVVFGLVGAVTSLVLLIRALIKAFEIYKMDNNTIFPLAFVSMQVIIILTIYWLLESPVYYIIMLAYIDIKHRKLLNIHQNNGGKV